MRLSLHSFVFFKSRGLGPELLCESVLMFVKKTCNMYITVLWFGSFYVFHVKSQFYMGNSSVEPIYNTGIGAVISSWVLKWSVLMGFSSIQTQISMKELTSL